MRALELSDDWLKLLEIVSWMQIHPRPDVYLRQVDIPGVHSKYIEANRSILTELFDMVLAPEMIDLSATGISGFSARYGFREKPLRIRFRYLDPHLIHPSFGQDITLDAQSFARLNPKVSHVYITENEINYLAFPLQKDRLVIFGAGYGFEMLTHSKWLSHCRIYYWGDIDTHGFAILDQLRSQLPHTESILMDRTTLLKFKALWGEEEKQTMRDLTRLTLEESSLYDDLRDNRIQKKLRLEQERISFGWLNGALKNANTTI